MQKRHFIALADELKDVARVYGLGVGAAWDAESTIRALCHFMRQQNGSFNEQRWRSYLAGRCGPNGGNIQ